MAEMYSEPCLIWLFICCKTKLEKNFFYKKCLCFYKIYIFCRQNRFYMEKKFYNEKIFLLKKTFFTEKNYVSFQKYIFTQKIFALQIKYESFLNIYSFCKKKKKMFLIIKNIFVKTSL